MRDYFRKRFEPNLTISKFFVDENSINCEIMRDKNNRK